MPEVLIDRFYIPGHGHNPRMIVDLAFRDGNGDFICTVKGFKLMARTNGGWWLAIPQRQHKDGNWTDVFAWGTVAQAEEARQMVHRFYEEKRVA